MFAKRRRQASAMNLARMTLAEKRETIVPGGLLRSIEKRLKRGGWWGLSTKRVGMGTMGSCAAAVAVTQHGVGWAWSASRLRGKCLRLAHHALRYRHGGRFAGRQYSVTHYRDAPRYRHDERLGGPARKGRDFR